MERSLYVFLVLVLMGSWLAGTGFFLQEKGLSLNLDFNISAEPQFSNISVRPASNQEFFTSNLFAHILSQVKISDNLFAGANAPEFLVSSAPKKLQTAQLFGGGATAILQVAVTGNGGISGSGINCSAVSGDCNETYAQDSVVGLQATLNSGSVFVAWQGCNVHPSNPLSCFVVMSADKSVAARFYQAASATPSFTLNLTKSGSDSDTISGSGINCGFGCSSLSENYSAPTNLTLTAAPGVGVNFSGWSLVGGTAGDSCAGNGSCVIQFACPTP